MNSLTLIGNLTRDPELRTTASGLSVCNFTVAVNRKFRNETDFFRVAAFRQLGELCAKFLKQGSKCAVVGSVSVSTYEKDGKTHYNLDVQANEVEFLSKPPEEKFIKVENDEDLPF